MQALVRAFNKYSTDTTNHKSKQKIVPKWPKIVRKGSNIESIQTHERHRERQGERDNKQLMSKTIEKDSIEFIKNKKGLQTRRSQYPNHHPCWLVRTILYIFLSLNQKSRVIAGALLTPPLAFTTNTYSFWIFFPTPTLINVALQIFLIIITPNYPPPHLTIKSKTYFTYFYFTFLPLAFPLNYPKKIDE